MKPRWHWEPTQKPEDKDDSDKTERIIMSILCGMLALLIGLIIGCHSLVAQDIELPPLRFPDATNVYYLVQSSNYPAYWDTEFPKGQALQSSAIPTIPNLHTQVVLVPVTNIIVVQPTQALHIARISPSMPPIPALPKITVLANTTNEHGEVIEVRKKVFTEPPPLLIQDKPRTNTAAFWVKCPHCSVRAIRTPKRIETNGVVAVPDGNTFERTIYFRCCQQEFRARNFKFEETPIAEEVVVPKR